MSSAAEALASTVSGSSLLTTTGGGAEVSLESVLLICGIFAGRLAWPLFAAFFSAPPRDKLSASFLDEAIELDGDNEESYALRGAETDYIAGVDKSHSTKGAGLAL